MRKHSRKQRHSEDVKWDRDLRERVPDKKSPGRHSTVPIIKVPNRLHSRDMRVITMLILGLVRKSSGEAHSNF